MRDAAQKVTSAASELGQQAMDKGNRYTQDVIEQVEKQPVVSVLIAAATGFVLGLLMARR